MRRALLLLMLLAACKQDMADGPHREALEASATFPDGASARPQVPGTVDRTEDLSPVPDTIPVPVDMALLERGRERFGIFCTPCHGLAGDGDGMIVRHGFPHPPSYHTPALRAATDRHLFDVITDGYGVMYPYGSRVPPADRWAIVAYIRALQLSRHAPVADLGAPAGSAG
ncbi:ABC-type Fe3+ transport system protein, Molybdenum transport protein, putative [Rubellimicrobium mesophilum DSM 19309]|uniref:ABC-type Fe3+ transport system protein, Molybdenum transport protein, putative n=1 Tax=Rubellimicrobium mesophilum DSM 19309 TaxID=442562 RepID=A0A017HIF0_9RHOB|nr:cytochrome c [Rubellimicrobium mesophilum]EYD73938.1 ABC-type Fe3+ transport system protein, Molybdenum transport protein, putative [Rubellimicrobium mesophilum DSM 19309]